ncbi:hypothetical protein NPIL_109101 [Nephila pilipes]|uniref:Uncharacterized protein n=1 Tax=Nephila pilipes TaxID=299642 RepID=A0A8X6T3Z4_NEPPI|nr:hypothetical protein NPIL_109101 [Nephila pilipes]
MQSLSTRLTQEWISFRSIFSRLDPNPTVEKLNELRCIQFNVASSSVDFRAAETMSHFVEESFSPFYLWNSRGLFEGKRKFNNRSSRSAGSREVLVGRKKLPRHVRDFETAKVGKKYMKQI